MTYSLVESVGRKVPVTIICPDHGPFKQTLNNHINGKHACPSCESGGFKTTKTGNLYYLRINHGGRSLYKIGITNRLVEERFSGSDLQKITVLRVNGYTSGWDALNAGTAILRKYADFRYWGEPVLSKVGTAEIFTEDVLRIDSLILEHKPCT